MRKNLVFLFLELLSKFVLTMAYDCLDCEKNLFSIGPPNTFCSSGFINSKIYAFSNGSIEQYEPFSDKKNTYSANFLNFKEKKPCALFSPDEIFFIIIQDNKLNIWNKEKRLELCEIIESSKIIFFEGEPEKDNYFYLVKNGKSLKSVNYKTCEIKNITSSAMFLDADIGAYDKNEQMFIVISFKNKEFASFNIFDKCIQTHDFKSEGRKLFMDFPKKMIYFIQNQSLAAVSYKGFNEIIFENQYLPIKLDRKITSGYGRTHLLILQNYLQNYYNFLLYDQKNAKLLSNNLILINSLKLSPVKSINLQKKINCIYMNNDNFSFEEAPVIKFENIDKTLKNRFLHTNNRKNERREDHNENNDNSVGNDNKSYDANNDQKNSEDSEFDKTLEIVLVLVCVAFGLICLMASNNYFNPNKIELVCPSIKRKLNAAYRNIFSNNQVNNNNNFQENVLFQQNVNSQFL